MSKTNNIFTEHAQKQQLNSMYELIIFAFYESLKYYKTRQFKCFGKRKMYGETRRNLLIYSHVCVNSLFIIIQIQIFKCLKSLQKILSSMASKFLLWRMGQ